GSVRGIRGAITVEEDTPAAILAATIELLLKMLEANGIQSYEELAAVIFTVTEDLTSAFPAEAARLIGMHRVPLLSAREVPVPGSLPRVIRVLALWNTDTPQDRVRHVYLNEAVRLRPDLESAQLE
uniref:BG505 SOSIP-T33-31B n=1 Tax=Human immunodeficiency virus type 1 TaxID=11676 RepID=UPI001C611273|nr:Chain B, BG505 SOSIP-T33-31B [Human immunodeficiency virus 1]7L85_C Chain C, BG505 SOSIP-T33-31B [Human immunodeficiency virus 1]7L85_E Chain E, BG505 SOSIP-T33-31B [Human immunodeficiency virus 1]7L85_G Chain G, BG505 SOSIP-T33-31B [Human immunodeficiency virus 1]7L85_I Chain I, BG505 SOSIP-T33-31B [Human immunodeficiency virus 1]7L85_K Chain K, BG505 SOSIP-T33-31B [Human immunodeficiency virus 1]7L85_M Chain M, BG505 SOSIP-T33-31B [Human immunodeficiency virus 1]7L85_O Chain O, BG505 SO